MSIIAHAVPRPNYGMTITVTNDGQTLHTIELTSDFDEFNPTIADYFVRHDVAGECDIRLQRVGDWTESDDGGWVAEFQEPGQLT